MLLGVIAGVRLHGTRHLLMINDDHLESTARRTLAAGDTVIGRLQTTGCSKRVSGRGMPGCREDRRRRCHPRSGNEPRCESTVSAGSIPRRCCMAKDRHRNRELCGRPDSAGSTQRFDSGPSRLAPPRVQGNRFPHRRRVAVSPTDGSTWWNRSRSRSDAAGRTS